jgi:hypothetical protein
MWQIVDDPNITTTIHLEEFAMVELDVELHAEYGCLDTMLSGKLQRSRPHRYQSRVRKFQLDKQQLIVFPGNQVL